MSKATLSREALQNILKDILKSGEYTLYAPVRNRKALDFAEISDDAQIVISDEVSYKSPKEVLFPQVELMMTFKDGEVEESAPERKTVIFGAKPCDAEALRVLHAILMTGKFEDPFFRRRFENNVIIAVGCEEEKPGCFCSVRGVDRMFSDFADVMLTPTEGGYVVFLVSDKGREFWKKFDDSASDEAAAFGRIGQKDVKKLELDKNLDDAQLFNIIDWGKATEICQGCGMCTFICPSCHCFDIKDVTKKGWTKRYRCWDSCIYPKFTLHASGHNPRETIKERFRQRVLHKYLYINKNFGYTACTGCGRCIRNCPAGMNIRKVVESIMEVLP